MLHTWRNVLRVAEQDYGGESRLIAVGPARDGALLELVLVPDDAPTQVIHANYAPPFLPQPTEVMTMPHAHTKPTAAEQAEGTEKWLDRIDPAQLDFRDSSHVRAIIAAAGALAKAEENLRQDLSLPTAAKKPCREEKNACRSSSW